MLNFAFGEIPPHLFTIHSYLLPQFSRRDHPTGDHPDQNQLPQRRERGQPSTRPHGGNHKKFISNKKGNTHMNNQNTTPITSTADMPAEIKSLYDAELLDNAKADMIDARFAKRQPLPERDLSSV